MHSAVGSGIGDVTADDLIFIDQKRGIYRVSSPGEVVHLIHIAHHRLPGKFAQVIPLTLLQRIVAVEDLVAAFRNAHLPGFHRRSGNIPRSVNLIRSNAVKRPSRKATLPAAVSEAAGGAGQPAFEIDDRIKQNPAYGSTYMSIESDG